MSRRFSLPRDVGVGIVSAVLAVAYLVEAMRITPDPSQHNVMGPRIAPLTIGIATLLCAAALVVKGLRERHEAAVPEAGGTEAGDAQERSWTRVLIIFAIFTGYIFVFIPLGYVVATFVFLIALTTYLEPGRWIRNVVYAAAFAGVVYLVFTLGLGVQLPSGLFG